MVSPRKERLYQAVEQLRRQRTGEQVRIPVKPDVLCQEVADLLTKLYQISVAASNNFNLFRAATESVEQRSACKG